MTSRSHRFPLMTHGVILATLGALVASAPAVLAQTFRVYGTITTQTGGPIQATVDAILPSSGTIVATTTSSPAGAYELRVAPGTYDIRVTPAAGSGYQRSTAPSCTITGDTNIDFVLVPPGIAMPFVPP